jgi:hypothetical protein
MATTTVTPELLNCPRAAPSDEQRAIAARVEALARRLEPRLPEFETIWVNGRGSGSARLGEAITGARHRIVLRTDLAVAGLASTAAHEIGHLVDSMLGRPVSEATADNFAARLCAQLQEEDDPMPVSRTIAAGSGRCARCQGRIEPGDEYVRETEDAAGYATRSIHVVCPIRTTHAGPRGAAPSLQRCVCGGFLLGFARTRARRCGVCARLYLN